MMAVMGRRKDDGDDATVGHRIASNIRALRRAHNLTQGQLAYKAKLPQSAVSALEMGRRNPSLMSAHKVSRAFGVSIDELAGFKPLQIPEAPASADDQDLREQVAAMNDRMAELSDAVAGLLESRSRSGTRKKSA